MSGLHHVKIHPLNKKSLHSLMSGGTIRIKAPKHEDLKVPHEIHLTKLQHEKFVHNHRLGKSSPVKFTQHQLELHHGSGLLSSLFGLLGGSVHKHHKHMHGSGFLSSLTKGLGQLARKGLHVATELSPVPIPHELTDMAEGALDYGLKKGGVRLHKKRVGRPRKSSKKGSVVHRKKRVAIGSAVHHKKRGRPKTRTGSALFAAGY